VRFDPDEWLLALGIELHDGRSRRLAESLQWHVALDVLRCGGTAILEWGPWSRAGRDALREQAQELGATIELRVLDEPLAVRWSRVNARNAGTPEHSRITVEQLASYDAMWERPTAAELSLFDVSLDPVAGDPDAPDRP